MAKRHTTNGTYTNPEVRFERTDIEADGVFWSGVGLAGFLVVTFVVMIWMGGWLFRRESPRKITDLPPAKVDDDRLPPQPRLEALEDLMDNKPQLFPARAEEYLAAQKALLKDGGKGVLPIQETLALIADKLPTRQQGNRTAPEHFGIRLPSKAAAGQQSTGGM